MREALLVRDMIIRETVSKMNNHGGKFTMAELAQDLAVSKSTIYRHFASKQALISAIGDLVLADIREQTASIIADSDLSSLEKFYAILTACHTRFGSFNNRLKISGFISPTNGIKSSSIQSRNGKKTRNS